MIDIYICEDNEKQRLFIKKRIEDIVAFEQLDMRIVIVSDNASDILEKAKTAENCGLYFLDIELKTPEINGIQLAQSIRKIEPRCFIVFITSHFELSYYTYQYKVEALDFIIKENPETIKNKIQECMLNAYEKHTGGSNMYKNIFEIITPNDKKIAVKYEDIICFETLPDSHKICLHAKARRVEFSDQLKNIETRLNNDFMRCHKSVIINLKNIMDVNYKDCLITMCDGSTYPLSVRKKTELKKLMKKVD